MNIVYLGTPDFAVEPLKRIVENGKHKVVAVVTNKDKPFGRKKILTAPPVKEYALSQNIPVYQYDKIRVEGEEDMKALCPDLMVTCAFGQILSQEILDIPKKGVINIHASLLPKYRGASPIHYAILNGEKETGITIMKTDIGIDTGDTLIQEKIAIKNEETCGELFDRLSIIGADLIVKALELIDEDKAIFVPQDQGNATITKIIKKEDALIDWSVSCFDVVNKIRAFNPAPIAYTTLNGEPFKIYKAKAVDGKGDFGQIINADKQLIVACGEGAVKLEIVQKAGGKAMLVDDFLRGNKLQVGQYLGK